MSEEGAGCFREVYEGSGGLRRSVLRFGWHFERGMGSRGAKEGKKEKVIRGFGTEGVECCHLRLVVCWAR